MEVESTAIGTMRVRWAGRDTPLLRLGLADLLEGGDLNPGRAAPDTILFVRRLISRQPLRLTSLPLTTGLDAGWAGAVRQKLERLYSSAAHVRMGRIPKDAGAVLFANESELLACLALALRQDTASRCWWCRAAAVAWSFALPITLDRLLCIKPRALPGALNLLQTWRRAKDVVNGISPAGLQSLLMLLVRTYGLDNLDMVLTGSSERSQTQHDSLRQCCPAEFRPGGGTDMDIPDAASMASDPMTAVWNACFPPELRMAGTSKAGKALLVIGLGLHRQPALMRSRVFYRWFSIWWGDTSLAEEKFVDRRQGEASHLSVPDIHSRPTVPVELADRPKTIPAAMPPVHSDPGKFRPTPCSPNQRPTGPSMEKSTVHHRSKKRTPLPRSTPQTPAESSIAQLLSSDTINYKNNHDGRGCPSGTECRHTKSHACTSPQKAMPAGPANLKAFVNLEDQGVDTSLAGAFYLINLMVTLDLPHCFEKSCALAGSIGAWGLLEALNRTMLDSLAEDLSADPLWSILARLDGRKEGRLPGERFQWDGPYRLPVHWHPQTNARWYWAADRQRLRLWSDHGYLLAELQRTSESPTHQANQLLRAYGKEATSATLRRRPMNAAPLAYPHGGLTRELNSGLLAWLCRVLPYIDLHLNRSLGLGKVDGADLAKALCLYPGRIHVSSSHVDVVMRMDQISMPIRLAGLDRNPRWVPMFGRVILFHYK